MQGYHYIVVNSSYIDRSITLRNSYALIGRLFLLLIMNTLGFEEYKKMQYKILPYPISIKFDIYIF